MGIKTNRYHLKSNCLTITMTSAGHQFGKPRLGIYEARGGSDKGGVYSLTLHWTWGNVTSTLVGWVGGGRLEVLIRGVLTH